MLFWLVAVEACVSLYPKWKSLCFFHIHVCKKAPEIRPSSLQDPQKGYEEQGLQQSCPVSLINISFKRSGNHHLQSTLHNHQSKNALKTNPSHVVRNRHQTLLFLPKHRSEFVTPFPSLQYFIILAH